MYIRWVRDVRCNFDNNVDDAPERDASSNPLKKSVRLFDNNFLTIMLMMHPKGTPHLIR